MQNDKKAPLQCDTDIVVTPSPLAVNWENGSSSFAIYSFRDDGMKVIGALLCVRAARARTRESSSVRIFTPKGRKD